MTAEGNGSGGADRYDVLQYDVPDEVDTAEIEFEQEVYAVPAGTGEEIVADHRSVLARHGWLRTAGTLALGLAAMALAVSLGYPLLGVLLLAVIVVFDRVLRLVLPTTVAPEVVAASVDRRTATEEYDAEIADGDPFAEW